MRHSVWLAEKGAWQRAKALLGAEKVPEISVIYF
jgi:hypothetical protein